MAIDPFSHSEELLERLGTGPILLDESWTKTLLTGIDHICRTLNIAIRRDMSPQAWAGLTTEGRERLARAYQDLGHSAEVLNAETGLGDQDFAHPHLQGEVLHMAQQSALAQYTATCLSSRYDEFHKLIHADHAIMLAVHALKALAAWKGSQEYFDSSRAHYDKNNLTTGLSLLERALWPSTQT